MDIVYAALVLSGGLYLLSTSAKKTISPERLEDHELLNLDVRQCKAICDIKQILTSNGKQSKTITDSMNLMLYQIDNPGVDLCRVIPEDARDVIENGYRYMSRFTEIDGEIFSFLAGVIEREVEDIRLDNVISYRDKESIRKLVDIFYYKELRPYAPTLHKLNSLST